MGAAAARSTTRATDRAAVRTGGQTKETRLVRIKPVNKRAGTKVRRYMFQGQRFDEERGWYEVDLKLANKLAKLAADDNDPESPLVFDVCTRDEAIAIEEREQRAAERATAAKPNAVRRVTTIGRGGATRHRRDEGGDLTTDDLPANQRRRTRAAEVEEPEPEEPETEEEDLEEDLEEGAEDEGDEDGGDEGDEDESAMLDPDPDGEELEDDEERDRGRVQEIGRVSSQRRAAPARTAPKTRQAASAPAKTQPAAAGRRRTRRG